MEIPEKWHKVLRVAVVVLSACSFMFALWTTLLMPLNKQRRELENAISSMKSQLSSEGYMLPQDILELELDKEIRYGKTLKREWSNTVSRITGFPGSERFIEIDIGKIDYKVALFDTKQRLLRKAKALDINLPKDIGMDSAVRGNEDARQLMFQLKAVEQLLDLILDLKIKTVRFVEPRPAVGHKFGGAGDVFLEEYPVKVQFFGNMKDLYSLLDTSIYGKTFFVLKQFRIEAPSEESPDILNISTVMSSLLFIAKPEELTLVLQEPVKRKLAPGGH